MNQPPDDWTARVFESMMRVKEDWQNPWSDELVSNILLDMRVGEFKEGNKNLFKRYHADLFRCHVCNHVLGPDARAAQTMPHLQLHRSQVRRVLQPGTFKLEADWSHTNAPTPEEVARVDAELLKQEGEYLASFRLVDRTWRKT